MKLQWPILALVVGLFYRLALYIVVGMYTNDQSKSLTSASGTICGFFRYFRTNNPMEVRTMRRTNLAKNGFSEALVASPLPLRIFCRKC